MRTGAVKNTIFVCVAIVTVLALVLTGCGKRETGETKPAGASSPAKISDRPGFVGWQEYVSDFVTIYYAPDSSLEPRLAPIAESIKRVFTENAARLLVDLPPTIYFYFYNNGNEIKERFPDHDYTFVIGDTIHYMLMTPLGEPIMVWLLHKFDPDGTPCKFCYEGLVTLFDYSGRIYARDAYVDWQNGKIGPIEDLLYNQRYLALDSNVRTAAAASFVEMLVSPPWIPEFYLKLLLQSLPPDSTVKVIYGQMPKQLEELWHRHLRARSGLEGQSQ